MVPVQLFMHKNRVHSMVRWTCSHRFSKMLRIRHFVVIVAYLAVTLTRWSKRYLILVVISNGLGCRA